MEAQRDSDSIETQEWLDVLAAVLADRVLILAHSSRFLKGFEGRTGKPFRSQPWRILCAVAAAAQS
jgi:hypothetical protein